MTSLTDEQRSKWHSVQDQLGAIAAEIKALEAKRESIIRELDGEYDEYLALCEDDPMNIVEYWMARNELDELHEQERQSDSVYSDHRWTRRVVALEKKLGI